ncbi:hypothetical protein D3C75_619430 [compost metagenome]
MWRSHACTAKPGIILTYRLTSVGSRRSEREDIHTWCRHINNASPIGKTGVLICMISSRYCNHMIDVGWGKVCSITFIISRCCHNNNTHLIGIINHFLKKLRISCPAPAIVDDIGPIRHCIQYAVGKLGNRPASITPQAFNGHYLGFRRDSN